jgi:hypothetical protein
MPRLHCHVKCNNMPGIMPVPILDNIGPQQTQAQTRAYTPQTCVPLPSCTQQPIVTQHAINALTTAEHDNINLVFTPNSLIAANVQTRHDVNSKHYASPMVHPVTGETISSYKKLMHNPATAETWQTAFGKKFGSMVQGNKKTRQKGTNAMFVMTHNKIQHVTRQGKKCTYSNLVVDYCPQKEDPHQICITAGGNLITYDSSPSVNTVDLDMAKLHWNSVISTKGTKYMCLDIKNFYLMAHLDYFEYMRMPLTLFPSWTQE